MSSISAVVDGTVIGADEVLVIVDAYGQGPDVVGGVSC